MPVYEVKFNISGEVATYWTTAASNADKALNQVKRRVMKDYEISIAKVNDLDYEIREV
jgi:hypothetical protein